jgi:hypothetical protein
MIIDKSWVENDGIGKKMNPKDQGDVKITCKEANPDLNLAWKTLDIARMIVAESPRKILEKFNIFYALVEVYMKKR